MTAFSRYKKYVLKKSIIISVAVGVTISIIFAAFIPVIEKSIPNADNDTQTVAVVQEAENE